MPVLMSYLPVPSRLMAAAMRVSLVARDTKARRPPLPGVVSIWVTVALGEALLAGVCWPGGPSGIPLGWQPVHTGSRAARSSATRVRMTPKSTIRPPSTRAAVSGSPKNAADRPTPGDRDQVHVDHDPAHPQPLEAGREAEEGHAHGEDRGVEPVAQQAVVEPGELAEGIEGERDRQQDQRADQGGPGHDPAGRRAAGCRARSDRHRAPRRRPTASRSACRRGCRATG